MDPSASQQKRQSDAQPGHGNVLPLHGPGALPMGNPQGVTVPVCAAAIPVGYSPLLQSSYAHQQPAYLWIPVALAHQPHLLTVGPAPAPLAYPPRADERQYPSQHRPADMGAWQAGTIQPVSLHQPMGMPRQPGPARPQQAGRKFKPEPTLEPEEMTHASDSADEEGSDGEEVVERREPEEAGPAYGDGWDCITEPIMQMVVQRLDVHTQQRCRLVSRRWNYYFTNNLQALQPRRAKVHTIREKFRSLTALDFSACENVRNRNLAILVASPLKLRSVAIGHVATLSHGKPRITNSALASLSKLPTLTSLSLSDCSAITNNGMQVLASLTGLQRLAFVRCPRISEKGLELIRSLRHLRSLTVYGCSKVTDRLLELAGQVEGLESLHVGHMRLQPERLAALASHPALRELSVHGEELSQAALAALASFTRLHALGMTTCYQVNGPLALTAMSQLGGLRRLNIQSFGDLSDAHLFLVATTLPELEQLKVVLGPTITSAGVEFLVALKRLRALSCESMQASPGSLAAVSKLTTLRVAEFPGTRMPPQLLDAVQRLPCLEALNLSSYEPQSMLHAELLLVFKDLQALTNCARLRRLDLSNAVLPCYMASDLLARFSERDRAAAARGSSLHLEELCLCGCPIEHCHVEQLSRAYPLVHVHQNKRGVLPSSTWVWDEQCHT